MVRWDQTAGDWRILNSSLHTSTILDLQRTQEVLSGQLVRSSNSVIKLQPINGVDVAVGIDDRILRTTGNLSWDMVVDLEQTEAASKRLYLYVRNNAGVLDEQISETAPNVADDTKPGYKAGDATWRCIGSTYNDLGQDLVECSWGPGGRVLFHSHDADHEHDLSLTQAGWSSVVVVNIPLCASAVLLHWYIAGTSDNAALGASNATVAPTVGRKILGTNAGDILLGYAGDGSSAPIIASQFEMPIANMKAPGFKFTTYGGTLGGAGAENDVVVTGYIDIFAPK